MLLTMQFLAASRADFSFPLTLSFLFAQVCAEILAFGIAIYALNLELSLNISASLEGCTSTTTLAMDFLAKNVPLALLMSLSAAGHRRQGDHGQAAADVFGLVAGGTGLAFDLCGSRPGQPARLA